MTFRARLLVFGYPLVEVLTAYLVAQWLGWGWMLLLLLLGFPIGFALMRRAGLAAMADVERAASTGEEPDASRHALAFLGGLLVFVPGFWTDLVGLLLVVPLTQRLFRRYAGTWASSRLTTIRMPGVYYPSGDVIQGTVIHVDDEPDSRPPGPRGELSG